MAPPAWPCHGGRHPLAGPPVGMGTPAGAGGKHSPQWWLRVRPRERPVRVDTAKPLHDPGREALGATQPRSTEAQPHAAL